MLRWPIRLAGVIAMTVLAYGWGDWWRERPLLDGILLGLLSLVLFSALAWLFRPGGIAAFEDAAGPAATAAAGPPARESRRERVTRPEPATPPAPGPAPTPTSPGEVHRPRARDRNPGGSLWSDSAHRDPSAALASGPGGARAAGDVLDLNSVTADELAVLPGIGRGAAGRVVAHRDLRGPFGSVEQLAEVEGFDAARVARVAGRLRV